MPKRSTYRSLKLVHSKNIEKVEIIKIAVFEKNSLNYSHKLWCKTAMRQIFKKQTFLKVFFGSNNKWFEVEQILTKASFMWLALRHQSFAHQPKQCVVTTNDVRHILHIRIHTYQ